jgi:SAM-dependent methyltransferase
MQSLIDIVSRSIPPEPWHEGEKIPWNEPGFSARMLREHLSQAHDRASRRAETIDAHVRWIHHALLRGAPARVLDLGCGPGLYTSRLAELGHQCHGIDFGPAAIGYAADQARERGLACTYACEDIRTAEFGTDYDLVMLLFGEFNVFRPADIRHILERAAQALAPAGWLLIEPTDFAAVRRIGADSPSWYAAQHGLFSDQPHICLYECFWDAERFTATERFYIVDAATGAVARYAATTRAYTDDELRALLAECGFRDISIYASLGDAATPDAERFAVTARRAS